MSKIYWGGRERVAVVITNEAGQRPAEVDRIGSRLIAAETFRPAG